MLFSRIIGQDSAKIILSTLYQKKHYPPLLFVGPKGVGKRTTAINFAQIINCPEKSDLNCNQCTRCKQVGDLNNFDIKLVFPIPQKRARTSLKIIAEDENQTSVPETSFARFSEFEQSNEREKLQTALAYIGENIKDYAIDKTRPDLPATNYHPIEIVHWLSLEMSYKPIIGTNKVIIIVDADRMRHDAANALLKTLEEPQKDTLFILTTERISNMLPTICSRCQTINFTILSRALIAKYLVQQKQVEPAQAEIGASVAEGSLRKAINYIENKNAFLPDPEILKLIDRELLPPMDMLNQISKKEYQDILPETVIGALLFVYRNALYTRLNLPVFYESNTVTKISKSLSEQEIISRISFLLNTLNDTGYNLNKKLFLFSILTKVKIQK
jgi:DNA polymerase-3 subunit delta'